VWSVCCCIVVVVIVVVAVVFTLSVSVDDNDATIPSTKLNYFLSY